MWGMPPRAETVCLGTMPRLGSRTPPLELEGIRSFLSINKIKSALFMLHSERFDEGASEYAKSTCLAI